MDYTRANLNTVIPMPLNIDGTNEMSYEVFSRFMLNSYGLLMEEGEFYLLSDPTKKPLVPGDIVKFVPDNGEADALVATVNSRRFQPGSSVNLKLIFPSLLVVLGKVPTVAPGETIAYRYQLRGGFVPYILLDTSGLPSTVTLSADGWLRGTAPSGSYPFTARWRDNAGTIAYLEDTILVETPELKAPLEVSLTIDHTPVVHYSVVAPKVLMTIKVPEDGAADGVVFSWGDTTDTNGPPYLMAVGPEMEYAGSGSSKWVRPEWVNWGLDLAEMGMDQSTVTTVPIQAWPNQKFRFSLRDDLPAGTYVIEVPVFALSLQPGRTHKLNMGFTNNDGNEELLALDVPIVAYQAPTLEWSTVPAQPMAATKIRINGKLTFPSPYVPDQMDRMDFDFQDTGAVIVSNITSDSPLVGRTGDVAEPSRLIFEGLTPFSPAGEYNFSFDLQLTEDMPYLETYYVGGIFYPGGQNRAPVSNTKQLQLTPQARPEVTISAQPATVVEGTSTVVRIDLNIPAPKALTIPISYEESTATLGVDFTGRDSVSIPEGYQSTTFVIDTVENNSQSSDSRIRVWAGGGPNHSVVGSGYTDINVAKAIVTSGWYITSDQKLYSAEFDKFASTVGKGVPMPLAQILSNEYIELNYSPSYAGAYWRPLGESAWRSIPLQAHGRCIVGTKIWSTAVSDAVQYLDTATGQTVQTTAARGNLLQGCKKLMVKYNASNNSWDTSQISIDEGATWTERGDFIGFPNNPCSATDGQVVMIGGADGGNLNLAMIDQTGTIYTRQLTGAGAGTAMVAIVPLETGWMVITQEGKVYTSPAADPLNFTAATGFTTTEQPWAARGDGTRVMLITREGSVWTNADSAQGPWSKVGSPVTNTTLTDVMLRGLQYKRYNVVDDIIGTVTPTVWYRLNDVAPNGIARDSSGNGYHGAYSATAAVGVGLSNTGKSLAPQGNTTEGGFTIPGTGFTLNAANLQKGQFWNVFLKRDPTKAVGSQYQHIVGDSQDAGLACGFQVSGGDEEVQWNMNRQHQATASRPRTPMPDTEAHMYTIVFRPQGGRDRYSSYVDGKRVTTLLPNSGIEPLTSSAMLYGGSPNRYSSSYGNATFMSELMAGPGWATDAEEASAIAKLYDLLKPAPVVWNDDWTVRSNIGGGHTVGYSPKLNRMVVGDFTSAKISYSDDVGQTWTAATVPSGTKFEQFIWSDRLQLFIGCGLSSAKVWSVDGITWTQGGGSSEYGVILIDTPTKVLAFNSDGAAMVSQSADGKTWSWSGQNIPSDMGSPNAVAYSPEEDRVVVAYSSGRFLYNNNALPTNTVWTRTGQFSAAIKDILWSSDHQAFFALVATTPATVMRSANGRTDWEVVYTAPAAHGAAGRMAYSLQHGFLLINTSNTHMVRADRDWVQTSAKAVSLDLGSVNYGLEWIPKLQRFVLSGYTKTALSNSAP